MAARRNPQARGVFGRLGWGRLAHLFAHAPFCCLAPTVCEVARSKVGCRRNPAASHRGPGGLSAAWMGTPCPPLCSRAFLLSSPDRLRSSPVQGGVPQESRGFPPGPGGSVGGLDGDAWPTSLLTRLFAVS